MPLASEQQVAVTTVTSGTAFDLLDTAVASTAKKAARDEGEIQNTTTAPQLQVRVTPAAAAATPAASAVVTGSVPRPVSAAPPLSDTDDDLL